MTVDQPDQGRSTVVPLDYKKRVAKSVKNLVDSVCKGKLFIPAKAISVSIVSSSCYPLRYECDNIHNSHTDFIISIPQGYASFFSSVNTTTFHV